MIDPFRKKSIDRLIRAKGQIEGIIKMIDKDEGCINILTQVLAVQGALKGVGYQVLESHLNTCGEYYLNNKNSQKKKIFIQELMKAFSFLNR